MRTQLTKPRAAVALGVLAVALTVPLVTVPVAGAEDAVVVDVGHVDAIAPRIVDGGLQVQYKDGSQGPDQAVWREPGTVVTHVKPESRLQVPDDPNYAFLGDPGDDLWIIPEQQLDGIVWAGWNTESLTPSDVDPASVRWTLDEITGDDRGSAPPGAMTVFQSGSFGEPLPRVFDTNQPLPQTYGLILGTHAHANWTFNAEGVYRLTFTVTATSADGQPLTDTETYTFAIGDVDPTAVQPGEGTQPPTTTTTTTTTTTAPTTTTATTTTTTSGTTTSTPAGDCVVLADGHVDAVAPRILAGRLTTQVKDGTRGPDQVVWREPDSVVLHAVPASRNTVPADSSYGFLGAAGSPVWLIPQTQVPGVVWAGWNTESLDSGVVSGDVTWRLSDVDGPGNVAVFLTGLTPTVVFNAADGLPDTTHIPLGTHAHGNWGFTAEGIYRLTFTVTATLATGETQTDTDTYTFAVGDVDASTALGGRCSGGVAPTSSTGSPVPGGQVEDDSPEPRGGGKPLAHTGAGGLAYLVPAGALLLVGGGALLVLVRRRRAHR